MNTLILTGNLGTDVETRFSTEGMQIGNFPLAFRSGKDKTGWIRVTCFGKTAENAEKHLHKGARVGVVGYLDQDRWESDGEKKTALKMIANQIEYIKTDGKGFNNSEDDDAPF